MNVHHHSHLASASIANDLRIIMTDQQLVDLHNAMVTMRNDPDPEVGEGLDLAIEFLGKEITFRGLDDDTTVLYPE
jgi:hypothetical protein